MDEVLVSRLGDARDLGVRHGGGAGGVDHFAEDVLGQAVQAVHHHLVVADLVDHHQRRYFGQLVLGGGLDPGQGEVDVVVVELERGQVLFPELAEPQRRLVDVFLDEDELDRLDLQRVHAERRLRGARDLVQPGHLAEHRTAGQVSEGRHRGG